jgi:hypothetical protein
MRAFLPIAGLAIGLSVTGLCGCASNDPPQPSQANSAQSAPYSPGTGVGSSSFDRHPRFYTGPNGEQVPATQPAGGQ